MTKEEEDTIKAEAARLGRPNPRTKADLSSLLLAVIAERDGKGAPLQSPKKPVGRPLGLSLLRALLFSELVSNKAVCDGLKRETQEDIGSPETLRTKISSLTTQPDKNIKNEKFKAKLLREFEDVVAVLLYHACCE